MFVLNNPSGSTETTSEIFDGQRWVEGPALPVAFSRHCSVEIAPFQVFLSGSEGNYVANLIDPQEPVFTRLNDMENQVGASEICEKMKNIFLNTPQDRTYHACGVTLRPGGDTDIVVVGGVIGAVSSSVEIYDVQERLWRRGTDYPFPVQYHSAAQARKVKAFAAMPFKEVSLFCRCPTTTLS